MSKEELLDILLNNVDCFDGVTLEDFCLLNSLEVYELGFMNDEVYKVTTLLKQIANYALIKSIINEEELSKLSIFIQDETILTETINIIEACYQYIECLQKEVCNHPSVLKNTDLVNAVTSYNEFNQSICDLIELTVDEVDDDTLSDLSILVNDELLDVTDLYFKKMEQKINTSHTDIKTLLLELVDYSKKFVNIILLMTNHNTITYVDNNYIDISKNNIIDHNYSLNLSEVMEKQMLIISKVEEYEEEFYEDEDIISSIERILESYFLYKSYKHKFLKDNYKESKLLKKCKKM